MPGSGTARFAETDDYEVGFRDVFADFILTHRGVFGAHTAHIKLRNLHLLRAQEALPRVAFVSLPPTAVLISFSMDPSLPLVWRGQTLDAGEIMLHSRGERLHQRTVGAACWGLISLPPASLAAFAKALTRDALTAPASGQILRPSSRDLKHLLRMLAEAARLAETKPQILRHPEVVRSMEQDLAGVLVSCLTESEPRIEADAIRRAADIMVRFEDVLATCFPQEWRLAELCAAVGVSERTLQNYCATFLGIAPTQYVQLRRLRRVRAAIRGADPRARIGDLARSGGFAEHGRFATLYRLTYGETPSATLRRSRDV